MASPSRPNRTLPPPSWMPKGNRGLRIDLRKALIPFSLAILGVLAFGVRVPWSVLVPIALIVPAFFVFGVVYVTKALPKFERSFNRALQKGDVDAMDRIYREARLLRLFAPAHRMLNKEGLVLMLRGQHARANDVLEEAYEAAPKSARTQLLGPLARVKYQLGDYGNLREIAEQWRARALFAGAPNLYQAAGQLYDPYPDLSLARELLEEVEGKLGPTETELREELMTRLEKLEASAG